MVRNSAIIVDDHAGFRKALRQFVESQGVWQVVGETNNARLAIELVATLHPNAVLMDICMPELDGIEACRRMRHADSKLEVVLYSADATEVELAKHQGVADWYFAKDFLFDELTEKFSTDTKSPT